MSNGLKAGGIEDFDGHTWEVFYMDMSKFLIEKGED